MHITISIPYQIRSKMVGNLVTSTQGSDRQLQA